MDANDCAKDLILLAEDERVMRLSFTSLLSGAGYRVVAASDGEAALGAFRQERPALVLLDVMMPKLDGYATCRRIRETDVEVPILFLTALDAEAAQIEGLGAGADDYISKAWSREIVLARVAAALRRRRLRAPTGDFDFGTWRVAASARELRGEGGAHVRLSERELAILRLLAAHPGEAFGRDDLATRFWADEAVSDNTMNACFYALRGKLGATGAQIKAVRGAGYLYSPEPAACRRSVEGK